MVIKMDEDNEKREIPAMRAITEMATLVGYVFSIIIISTLAFGLLQ